MTYYTISDEHGTSLPGKWPYSSACRIAYYVRKLGQFDCHIVDENTGRATSEVVETDPYKDYMAKLVARSLLDGDFESRLK